MVEHLSGRPKALAGLQEMAPAGIEANVSGRTPATQRIKAQGINAQGINAQRIKANA